MRFLWARMCFGTNYSTTEYEHDISPFYWKSTYYKQGCLFVDSLQNTVYEQWAFISCCISILSLNNMFVVLSPWMWPQELWMPWDVYWEYRIYATEREPATQMSGERHARPQKGGFLWMRTRKIARRPQNGLILWTNRITGETMCEEMVRHRCYRAWKGNTWHLRHLWVVFWMPLS